MWLNARQYQVRWSTLLVLLTFVMGGCDRCRTRAVEKLAQEGHIDVKMTQLVRQGCHYSYTSRKGPENCEGSLAIKFVGSLAQYKYRNRCTPAADRGSESQAPALTD